MKDYKIEVLKELERLCSDFHAVMLRRAALNIGIKHLKTQEAHEVLNAFIKAHPEFKIYILDNGNKTNSFFTCVYVTDNNGIPYAPEAIA